MSTSIRGKHFKALCIRWIIVVIGCLTSSAMGLCLVRWQGLWLYSLLLYLAMNKSKAISPDGEVICLLLLYGVHCFFTLLYHFHDLLKYVIIELLMMVCDITYFCYCIGSLGENFFICFPLWFFLWLIWQAKQKDIYISHASSLIWCNWQFWYINPFPDL